MADKLGVTVIHDYSGEVEQMPWKDVPLPVLLNLVLSRQPEAVAELKRRYG